MSQLISHILWKIMYHNGVYMNPPINLNTDSDKTNSYCYILFI
jgi:hypothetical protein